MYVVFILALFIIGLSWILLSKPMEYTYNRAYDDENLEDNIYQTFFVRTHTIWNYILMPIGIMLIISIILKVLQKNRLEGSGGY